MFTTSHVLATLPVSDLDRARTWYAEKLGLRAGKVVEGEGAFYDTATGSFALYPSDHAGKNPGTAAAFVVNDFDATVQQLRDAGVAFEEFDVGDQEMVDGVLTNPNGDHAAWFRDADGNILAVSSKKV